MRKPSSLSFISINVQCYTINKGYDLSFSDSNHLYAYTYQIYTTEPYLGSLKIPLNKVRDAFMFHLFLDLDFCQSLSWAECISLPSSFGLDCVTDLANGTWAEVTCANSSPCIKKLCTFSLCPLHLFHPPKSTSPGAYRLSPWAPYQNPVEQTTAEIKEVIDESTLEQVILKGKANRSKEREKEAKQRHTILGTRKGI